MTREVMTRERCSESHARTVCYCALGGAGRGGGRGGGRGEGGGIGGGGGGGGGGRGGRGEKPLSYMYLGRD